MPRGQTAHLKGKDFRANPQNINRKGQPKKLLRRVLDELRREGYEPVSRTQVEEVYSTLLGLTIDDVKTMANDPNQSMLLRIVAWQLLDGKRAPDMLERMLDRAHGKSTQRVDAEVKTNAAKIIINKTYAANQPDHALDEADGGVGSAGG